MFYIATAAGFLVLNKAETMTPWPGEIVQDIRKATPFLSFDDADRTGKRAVRKLFYPGFRYYTVLSTQ